MKRFVNKSVGLSEIQSPDPVWSDVITGNPCHMFFFLVSFQLSTVTIQAFKWEKTKKKKLNKDPKLYLACLALSASHTCH